MATVKFVLRYSTEQQKKKLQAIAKKCGRSANAHILHLIDTNIEVNKQVDLFNKMGSIHYQSGKNVSHAVGVDNYHNTDFGNSKATVIKKSKTKK